jgi:hypothetical protein
LFLNALRELVSDEREVLAAGDLNETRGWDETHPGGWGRDFFANVASAGLTDVTFSRWRSERRTRFHPTHPRTNST